jgi:thioredoxin reductase (NADPH)
VTKVVKIRIYTAPGCPFCQKLKDDLNACGVSYEEKVVTSDREAARELRSKGINQVPVIEADGKITVGYNPDWVRKNLCGR